MQHTRKGRHLRNLMQQNQVRGKAKNQVLSVLQIPRASKGIVIRDSPSANTRSSRKPAVAANKDPKNKGKEKVVY